MYNRAALLGRIVGTLKKFRNRNSRLSELLSVTVLQTTYQLTTRNVERGRKRR